jgi:hypothetical protein
MPKTLRCGKVIKRIVPLSKGGSERGEDAPFATAGFAIPKKNAYYENYAFAS